MDPASLAVMLARLSGIAEEGLAVLRRSASSPNIKERVDCSTALFTAAAELVAQSESIPVHLGSMPASVRAVVGALGELDPGEQAVVNDPYAGGTHLNDVTVVAPVHHGGVLVGWVANRAHHADVGGTVPGSIPADATHIDEEGIRLAPTRLTPEVRARFIGASRTPDERAGDFDAQAGANRVMALRLAELVAEGAPLDEALVYGERRMRAALSALPDGAWTFADVIDSTGAGAAQRQPAVIRVRVTVANDDITFDFTGTDGQSHGNVNAVEAVTVSAVGYALRAATDPAIPANGGAMRPVHVVAPSGSIVAARYPAAVGAGNVEVSQRVADVCLGALAQVAPDRVGAASQGTMNNLLIGGDGWVYYETIGGGQGGRPNGVAGQSGIHTAMTNTQNTPVEALERSFPLRVVRYRLRRDSGGAGVARGGDGIERDLEVLTDCTATLITERRTSRPWGLAGGGPGAAGENWLLPAGDEAVAQRLPDKCTVALRAGDVVRMLTPGGGGWGRDPRAGVADGLTIRRMVAGDASAWQRVFASVADEALWIGAEPPVPERGQEIEQRFVDSDVEMMLLAVVDSEVVGWASGERDADGTIELGMGVRDGLRGRGIGSALLEALLAWAGGRRMVLRVFPHNDRALALYRKFGFVLLEHKTGVWPRRNGEFWDLLFMERPADR